jgi:hypothetical protein
VLRAVESFIPAAFGVSLGGLRIEVDGVIDYEQSVGYNLFHW